MTANPHQSRHSICAVAGQFPKAPAAVAAEPCTVILPCPRQARHVKSVAAPALFKHLRLPAVAMAAIVLTVTHGSAVRWVPDAFSGTAAQNVRA